MPIVSAIEKLDGEEAAKAWLEGFADNAKRYNDNEGIIAAVGDGQVAAGIINHYYWYEAAAEEGKDKIASKLHYFGNEDPGALVNVSGAGALESSDDPDLAQEFLAYAVSEEGQSAMTHSGDWEYPLNSAVPPPPGLKPFDSLEPPKVEPGGPRRRQRAGRTDAAGGPALGDGGGRPPAQRSRVGGPVALGAAGPRAHSRGPAASSPPPSPCSSWRRSASSSTRPSRPAGTRSSGCCSGPSSASCSSTRRAWSRSARSPARSSASRSPGSSSGPTCPGRRVWAVLAALPIAVPGLRHQLQLGLDHPGGRRASGAPPLIVTLAYYPLVYLPVAAVLRGMDPALEESARSLGIGPWRTFFRVTLPQTRVALLGGMLLVALHLLAEFGAFAMLRFQTFTTAIYDQYSSASTAPRPRCWPRCWSCSACVLLVAELRLRGRGRYARVDSGSARPPAAARLGRAQVGARAAASWR